MTLVVPDAGRAMGWRVVGGKGCGKSRLAGRIIALNDLRAGYPVVVFDPVGTVSANFLDALARLPKKEQKKLKLAERVVYIDVAGSHGYVAPFPFLYRLGGESLYDIAQRFVDVAIKVDPALRSNPQLGANALAKIGTYTGVVLAALGWQLTEAERLLDDPGHFAPLIRQALATFPDDPALIQAVDFFLRTYPSWRPQERAMQTNAYRDKLRLLIEPTQRAIYGADRPALDWDDVVEQRKCVLLDFRNVPESRRKFTVVWLHSYLMAWIRRREPSKQTRPLSVIVDEATELLGGVNERSDPLADDQEELISRLSRNMSIWLTYLHQELHQLNPKAAGLFQDLGVQFFGVTSDINTAMMVAQRFFRWDPHEVKKTRQIYHPMTAYEDPWYEAVTEEYSRDESLYLDALAFLDLPAFTFLAGAAPREGQLPTRLKRISIADQHRDEFPRDEIVAQARTNLMRRHRPIEDVLAEVRERRKVEEPTGGKVSSPPTALPRPAKTPAPPPSVFLDEDVPPPFISPR